jgi:SAM-dependent MidA family methyltransferase
MELALYCPVYGYYEKEKDNIGRGGDFYTSTSVGELFGELLAFKFAQWLKELESATDDATANLNARESGRRLQIVEAGAHDGRLAEAILIWFQAHEPSLFQKFDYWILEPSDTRWGWQQERLKKFSDNICRAVRFEDLMESGKSGAGVRGVIFCNELLDSMPVHRLAWDAQIGKWFEWGVGYNQGRFSWERMEAASIDSLTSLPRELLSCLPDGFITELCPAATRWWQSAAAALREGRLLTLDYGFGADQFLAPERKGGTLRAYSKHHQATDLLAQPGEQDLTAHVNFGELRTAGEGMGLVTETFLSQEQFLLGIVRSMSQSGNPDWAGRRARELQTLTHPGFLGTPFSALIQLRRRS